MLVLRFYPENLPSAKDIHIAVFQSQLMRLPCLHFDAMIPLPEVPAQGKKSTSSDTFLFAPLLVAMRRRYDTTLFSDVKIYIHVLSPSRLYD